MTEEGELHSRVHVHPGDTDRVATVLPGRGYSPDFPILYYARSQLRAQGWTVREVRWGRLPEVPDLWPEHVHGEVAVELAVPALHRLIVAKSLGTHALPLAVEHRLPGVWLTPLLRDPQQCRALEQTQASTLVVGGTADALWDSQVARQLGHGQERCEIVEIDGLDHSLEVPGHAFASLDALQRVMRHIDDFVRRLQVGTASVPHRVQQVPGVTFGELGQVPGGRSLVDRHAPQAG